MWPKEVQTEETVVEVATSLFRETKIYGPYFILNFSDTLKQTMVGMVVKTEAPEQTEQTAW
jgi:hypothetical protein